MRFSAILAGAVLGMAALVAPVQAESFKVDSVHSSVVFGISHFNASTVFGRFNDKAGTFDLNDGAPDNINITVQATSVDTANQKRDDHLRGPDFFNAREFPTIEFKSTAVEPGADGKYKVTGDLTLHGQTKSITIDLKTFPKVDSPQGKTIGGIEARFTIKRTDFDMDFMSGAIGDEVELIVSLEGQIQ